MTHDAEGARRERILVVLLAGAGDVLMTTPMLEELRIARPHARIEALVMQKGTSRPMLEALPAIDEVVFYDFQVQGPLRSFLFCVRLRSRSYDLSVTPMPHNRAIYNVITFLIGARERWGFRYVSRGSLGGLFLTRRFAEDRSAHLVENNLRLVAEGFGTRLGPTLRGLRLEPDPAARQKAEEWIERHGLRGRRLIGVHPGSGATKDLWLKRMPPEKWVRVMESLAAAEGQAAVVLLGGPEEVELCRSIQDAAPKSLDVFSAAGFGLLEAAALISRMSCVAACDTLMTHVGAAMNTPVVSIHGPTPATATAPWATQAEIVSAGLGCSPCYVYSARGIGCRNPRRMACIQDIQPAAVAEAIQRIAR